MEPFFSFFFIRTRKEIRRNCRVRTIFPVFKTQNTKIYYSGILGKMNYTILNFTLCTLCALRIHLYYTANEILQD